MSKSRRDPKPAVDAMLQGAKSFHGHLGPYLVLGLRSGLVAIEALGRDPFKMLAVVETGPSPPTSCFIDGIQFATGCTMGKGNIKVHEGKVVSAIFYKGEQSLKVGVRASILEELDGNLQTGRVEDLALDLAKRSDDELFELNSARNSSGLRWRECLGHRRIM